MMDVELHNEIERLRQELLKKDARRDSMSEEVVGILRSHQGQEIDEGIIGMVRSALLQEQ